jgi:hypothetical protein
MQKHIFSIENSIRNDIKPDKFEIIFLPYKADCWDSMESIWLSAKDDPVCESYVIPVPYFSLLRGEKLGAEHYEGDSFPTYVPITDWREYDIDKRRPDAIVVHYPYDECNNTTRLHSEFFCSELRKKTDLLVYVPYYVHCTDNNVTELYSNTGGAIEADMIFVESEKVRDDYVRNLNAWKKSKVDPTDVRGNIEKKVIASGSPKYDKVINSKDLS